MVRPSNIAHLVRRYSVFPIAILVWALLAEYLRFRGAPAYFLPSPLAVAESFWVSVSQGVLPAYLADSLLHFLFAGTSGFVIGVVAGVLMGINKWVARFFYPLVNFFQSIGGIAIAPLLLVWFGYSTLGLVVAVNYTIFFPVALNTLTGVRTVPRHYIDATRTLGASRLQVIRDVILPGAMPNILLGLRLALAYGWRALIAVEMLFALDGLGFMVFFSRQFLDTPNIMLGMIVLGAIVLLIDQVIAKPLEQMTIARWGMVHR